MPVNHPTSFLLFFPVRFAHARNSSRMIDRFLKGAMSHTAHVRDEALHLENVRQLFQVLRVIQYQEFIVIYRSHPLTVRIVKR